jgi:hypothetical protein
MTMSFIKFVLDLSSVIYPNSSLEFNYENNPTP